jgi:hypothetical protein
LTKSQEVSTENQCIETPPTLSVEDLPTLSVEDLPTLSVEDLPTLSVEDLPSETLPEPKIVETEPDPEAARIEQPKDSAREIPTKNPIKYLDETLDELFFDSGMPSIDFGAQPSDFLHSYKGIKDVSTILPTPKKTPKNPEASLLSNTTKVTLQVQNFSKTQNFLTIDSQTQPLEDQLD